MTRCLKVLREAACLQVAERLFQSFTPLNEKHFLPFSVLCFGNLRSVDGSVKNTKTVLKIKLKDWKICSKHLFEPRFEKVLCKN